MTDNGDIPCIWVLAVEVDGEDRYDPPRFYIESYFTSEEDAQEAFEKVGNKTYYWYGDRSLTRSIIRVEHV